jgi:hypothetical protein
VDNRRRPRSSPGLETTMSDFLDGIRKSVQAARESASHQRDVRRREEEAEAARQKLDRQRAAELTELIWERIPQSGAEERHGTHDLPPGVAGESA